MTTDDIENYFGSTEKVAEFFGITSEAVYGAGDRGMVLCGSQTSALSSMTPFVASITASCSFLKCHSLRTTTAQ